MLQQWIISVYQIQYVNLIRVTTRLLMGSNMITHLKLFKNENLLYLIHPSSFFTLKTYQPLIFLPEWLLGAIMANLTFSPSLVRFYLANFIIDKFGIWRMRVSRAWCLQITPTEWWNREVEVTHAAKWLYPLEKAIRRMRYDVFYV